MTAAEDRTDLIAQVAVITKKLSHRDIEHPEAGRIGRLILTEDLTAASDALTLANSRARESDIREAREAQKAELQASVPGPREAAR